MAELRTMVFAKRFAEVFCDMNLNNPVVCVMDKIRLLKVESWKNDSIFPPAMEESFGFSRS